MKRVCLSGVHSLLSHPIHSNTALHRATKYYNWLHRNGTELQPPDGAPPPPHPPSAPLSPPAPRSIYVVAFIWAGSGVRRENQKVIADTTINERPHRRSAALLALLAPHPCAQTGLTLW